jgi:hypothetical protein
MVGAGGERSRKLTLRLIAVVTIVLFAGLVAIAIAYRQPIAEIVLMRQLRNLGLDAVDFSIRRFNAEVLELQNLSIGEGDGLDIAQIEAHFSARGLFASRLDALHISGVRLRGTLDETGLSFGALDTLFEENRSSADTSGPAALPAASIEIEDVRMEIASAEGPLRASLELQAVGIAPKRLEAGAGLHIAIQLEGCAKIQIDGLSVKSDFTLSKPLDLCLRPQSEPSVRISNEGAIEANLEIAAAEFAADLQIGGELQSVSGELPMLRMRASKRGDEFEASLETEAGRLEFARQAVGIRDIKLNASVSQSAIIPKGQIRIEEIFDTQEAARFQRLALKAQFEPRDSSVDFTMELANPDRELVIEVDGTHNLSDAAGKARLHLHAIDFKPDGLQPATLFPTLSGLLTETSGSIEMKGSVDWNADGMRGTVEVAASDMSATSEFATIEHLNGIIELNENGATLRDQTASVGRLDFGLELTDGLIRYQLKPGGIATIESTSWKFAGGELTTHGRINQQSENWETLILVKGVDLAKLIELVNLDGLSGSGTLGGELPIALVGEEIEIRNAVISSSGEAGIIQYHPDPGMSNIAAADPQFATTLAVLENFHYEQLQIEVSGSATGDVVILIHLAGSNPEYRDGHPIEFNLSLDARLSDLLRTGMRVYRMPERIEEKLRAFAEESL